MSKYRWKIILAGAAVLAVTVYAVAQILPGTFGPMGMHSAMAQDNVPGNMQHQRMMQGQMQGAGDMHGGMRQHGTFRIPCGAARVHNAHKIFSRNAITLLFKRWNQSGFSQFSPTNCFFK